MGAVTREELIETAVRAMHACDLHGVCQCGFHTYRDTERMKYHQAAVVVDAVLAAVGEAWEVGSTTENRPATG